MRRSLLALLLIGVVAPACAPIDRPGPLLSWDFEASEALTADRIGHGHEVHSEGHWRSAPGRVGRSAALEDASVEVAIDLLPAWTTAQWVQLNALPTEDFVFITSHGNGTISYTGWALAIAADGTPHAIVEGGTSAQETLLPAPDPMVPGRWTHLASSWDGGVLDLYVDGQLVADTDVPFTAIPDGGLPFVVGWDANQERRALDGQLDEVALWDEALDPSHIAALARHGDASR
ncbi:MAG: LamG domain-containing protein [Deltaproteobacteria bacterium]|nr:LamG domain-containing protein [Deltaproteobacteria bacterium]